VYSLPRECVYRVVAQQRVCMSQYLSITDYKCETDYKLRRKQQAKIYMKITKKGPIFWDITVSSPLKFNRRFGRICHFHLQDRRKNQTRKEQATDFAICFMLVIKMGRRVPPKRKLNFDGLQGVISHKMRPFRIIAARKPNPT
jgi:hypothetical protein